MTATLGPLFGAWALRQLEDCAPGTIGGSVELCGTRPAQRGSARSPISRYPLTIELPTTKNRPTPIGVGTSMEPCRREPPSPGEMLEPNTFAISYGWDGGARRNRTDDLFNAIEALSQLSYGPTLHRMNAPSGSSASSPWVEPPLTCTGRTATSGADRNRSIERVLSGSGGEAAV